MITVLLCLLFQKYSRSIISCRIKDFLHKCFVKIIADLSTYLQKQLFFIFGEYFAVYLQFSYTIIVLISRLRLHRSFFTHIRHKERKEKNIFNFLLIPMNFTIMLRNILNYVLIFIYTKLYR